MGMFDSLMVTCPQCSEQIEFQSKAGDCTLAHYNLDDVPPNIAGDCDGEVQRCKCGAKVKLVVQTMIHAAVVGGGKRK